ncbi:YtxH domain-containing protein [Domibacillus mangrovi]|uniref:General stress protein n=1 Tax=Domibacillus mangrovi TaxID=1714354 RepID=A0A1Q5P243_9BACI|nr:YtxH domain-containing protein [Domibacillus mangrovi]OKL36212.1 hypothetical protein BLL40_11420 [Domibacillus mangrovi]
MRNNNTYDQFNIKKNDATATKQPQYDNLDLNTDRYNNDDSINTKDFIIGALCGAFIGAATALMVAPKSGRELRDDLNVQAGSLKERASGLTDTAKDKTSTLTKTVQEQSTAIVDKVKSLKSGDKSANSALGNEEDADANSIVENVDGAVKDTVDTTADAAKSKLDETKKAFDDMENSSSVLASADTTDTSQKPKSEGWTDPAGKGIDEKKSNSGSNSTNSNTNGSNHNNKNIRKATNR